jgi:peptidoglycan/LPS O-acetylase OafA/YrhL
MNNDVSAPYQQFLRGKYFPSLDGLRCFSIIVVIWHRTAPHGKEGLLAKGYLGVELFFTISGFLITTLLLRELRENGRISLLNFYARRTLRIFPLYYTVLALYVLLVWRLEPNSPAGQQFFRNLPAFLTYTYNWIHTEDLHGPNRIIFFFAWSLATEEQFYLLWPWVVRFARKWQTPVLILTTVLLIHAGAVWGVSQGYLNARQLWVRVLLEIAAPIVLGCLAAYALDRPAGFRTAYLFAGQWWSVALSAVLLILGLALPGTPMILVYLAMAYLVTACCIRSDHPLRAIFANPVVRYIGAISYGMYLLHMLANNAARRIAPGLGGAATFVITVVVAIALASASYQLYERRFLKLKERFGGRARSPGSLSTLLPPGQVAAS